MTNLLASALTVITLAAQPMVFLQGKPWYLDLDLAGVALAEEESNSAGTARKLVFENEDKRIHLTVVMKPSAAGATAASIRDERWKTLQGSGPAEVDPKLWTDSTRAYFQYFSAMPVKDGPLHQKHVHTFLIHDGTRIEVHVSVTRFKEKDQAWLDGFQRSIRVVVK